MPTPSNIFYPCKHCLLNAGEIFLSPDIDPDDVKDIGTLGARESLKRRIRALEEEIFLIQDELKFIDRQGFSDE